MFKGILGGTKVIGNEVMCKETWEENMTSVCMCGAGCVKMKQGEG
jgi:hypothetical protein